MAVSSDDVRHIAGLARIGVPEGRVDALVQELNGILLHMEELQRVPSAGASDEAQHSRHGMSLQVDAPPCVPLAHAKEEFAPSMKLGFFLVPRLSTHEDAGEDS
jgi:aspartyl-tRNA(Asn)/glutamyl-tRNA(Gln) amidotransferase subunit C